MLLRAAAGARAQKTGRPRVDDRVAFNAVMYVLVTGIAWRYLPRELGCSPATAHRRLQECQRQGVWQRLHQELLQRLNAAGLLSFSFENVLAPGRYSPVVDLAHAGSGLDVIDRYEAGFSFVVTGTAALGGLIDLPTDVTIERADTNVKHEVKT